MPDLIALSVRHKGLGLRRLEDFVGATASIGGWDMVSRNLIGRTDDEGNRHEGLYPLFESVFGAKSQDPKNRIPASPPSPMATHGLARSSVKHTACYSNKPREKRRVHYRDQLKH